jgi:Protein of unknown function (DUF3300)
VHSNPGPRKQGMRILVAVVCALSLLYGDTLTYAQQNQPAQSPAPSEETPPPKIPNDQLDALVAPIALYPDPLLSQVLVASTYPLEMIQLQQWLAQHKDLKDDALVTAVEKENWDASIQAMAALPDAVKQLAENIKWTTDLGNAFLAQQNDVMDAVQRMRAKAKDSGNLKSTEQMKVETKVVESKTVVVIEQASPQVVYVPTYNPTVVYGPPVYPYPPIAYPVATAAISFGIGVAMGAAWGGGWGYGAGWGSNNDITINNNNNFVNHNNRNNINGGNRNNINGGNRNNINGGNRVNNGVPGGNNKWQHNPSHRGGAPYSNRATATKYGGSARGDSLSTRQANARQNQGQRGGRQQTGTMDRGSAGRQQPGASNRAGGAGNRASSNGGSRANNGGGNRGNGGGNNIGNRQVGSNGGSRNTSSFGGSSNKARAQSSSSRGASSTGGSRGGRSGGGGRRR